MTQQRCHWAGTTDPDMINYHDTVWGVPVHNDRTFFEFLTLEGAQAGLSWSTILHKRARYVESFSHFDPILVAAYDEAKVLELLGDPGLVRNRLKIRGTVINAQKFLEVQSEFGSFDAYIWRFVNGQPKRNEFNGLGQVPASTPESDAMSKDLKDRGFKFVGSTICYAFMQATGLVNDHTVDCFRWTEVQ
jgi:DNA-3-methyladenine glycosylase I